MIFSLSLDLKWGEELHYCKHLVSSSQPPVNISMSSSPLLNWNFIQEDFDKHFFLIFDLVSGNSSDERPVAFPLSCIMRPPSVLLGVAVDIYFLFYCWFLISWSMKHTH